VGGMWIVLHVLFVVCFDILGRKPVDKRRLRSEMLICYILCTNVNNLGLERSGREKCVYLQQGT
jgi:hypothetical protein